MFTPRVCVSLARSLCVRYQVNTIPETGLQSTSASNLATLRSWLTDCVAAGGSTATVSAASLRALQGLGLATGSLVTVLNLVMSLLDLPTPTLPPTAVRSEFTEQLHSYVPVWSAGTATPCSVSAHRLTLRCACACGLRLRATLSLQLRRQLAQGVVVKGDDAGRCQLV